MKKINKQLNLKRHKPVFINLIGGKFELHTHPELSIRVEADTINANMLPLIEDKGSHIEIGRQYIPGLLNSSRDILVRIYVPDESQVNFTQLAGQVLIAGSYDRLSASMTFGRINVRLDDLSLLHEADLEVSAGDVKINSEDNSLIKERSGGKNYQVFRMNPSGSISAHTSLGDVKFETPVRKYYYRSSESLQ